MLIFNTKRRYYSISNRLSPSNVANNNPKDCENFFKLNSCL